MPRRHATLFPMCERGFRRGRRQCFLERWSLRPLLSPAPASGLWPPLSTASIASSPMMSLDSAWSRQSTTAAPRIGVPLRLPKLRAPARRGCVPVGAACSLSARRARGRRAAWIPRLHDRREFHVYTIIARRGALRPSLLLCVGRQSLSLSVLCPVSSCGAATVPRA